MFLICLWNVFEINRSKISFVFCIKIYLFFLGYKSCCCIDVSFGKLIKVKGNMGLLVSFGYFNFYLVIICIWSIVVLNGYIVEMNIKDFEMNCVGGSEF